MSSGACATVADSGSGRFAAAMDAAKQDVFDASHTQQGANDR